MGFSIARCSHHWDERNNQSKTFLFLLGQPVGREESKSFMNCLPLGPISSAHHRNTTLIHPPPPEYTCFQVSNRKSCNRHRTRQGTAESPFEWRYFVREELEVPPWCWRLLRRNIASKWTVGQKRRRPIKCAVYVCIMSRYSYAKMIVSWLLGSKLVQVVG